MVPRCLQAINLQTEEVTQEVAIEVAEEVQTIAAREEDTTGILPGIKVEEVVTRVIEAAMRAIEVVTRVIEVAMRAIEEATRAIEEVTRVKEVVLKVEEEAMIIPIVEVEVAEGDTNNLIPTTKQALTLAITRNHQKEVVTKETTIEAVMKETTIVGEEDTKITLTIKVTIEGVTEVTITVEETSLREEGDINILKEVVHNSNGNSAKMESSRRHPQLNSNDCDTLRV